LEKPSVVLLLLVWIAWMKALLGTSETGQMGFSFVGFAVA
jgi:hypothetical protein